MIELKSGYNQLPLEDDKKYYIKIGRDGLGLENGVEIYLTGKDLKKLVALLNLSIGNVPQVQNPKELLDLMGSILEGDKKRISDV